MALPTDLTNLDFAWRGTVFCETTTKTSTDIFSMDFAWRGTAYVRNNATVAPPDQNNGTLDDVYQGLPFAHLAADRTMDLVYQGLPFTGGTEDRNKILGAGANSITITAGPVGIDGWHRKHPNPRNEMVYSGQEPSHVFPFIGVQAL